jgi:hypothetical protein
MTFNELERELGRAAEKFFMHKFQNLDELPPQTGASCLDAGHPDQQVVASRPDAGDDEGGAQIPPELQQLLRSMKQRAAKHPPSRPTSPDPVTTSAEGDPDDPPDEKDDPAYPAAAARQRLDNRDWTGRRFVNCWKVTGRVAAMWQRVLLGGDNSSGEGAPSLAVPPSR